MKRFLELAGLALVVAVPLWYRQRSIEQAIAEHERVLRSELEEWSQGWKRWGDELVRQLKRTVKLHA